MDPNSSDPNLPGLDAWDEARKPSGLVLPDDAGILVTMPRTDPDVPSATYFVLIGELKATFAEALHALPQPAAPTFADFLDTNAGGSVTLVPAAGVPLTDYFYKVGATADYVRAPTDGVISVGNVAGSAYAYSVATATRAQGPVAQSPAFTSYGGSDTGELVVAAPSWANQNDVANSIVLVPAPLPSTAGRPADGNTPGQPAASVPMAHYFYKLGADGVYAAAPSDGVINVGDVAMQVFAYSEAFTDSSGVRYARSSTAGSPFFTAAGPAPTAPSAPYNLVAVAGNGTVTVTATVPSSTGGSGITGYNWYRSDNPNTAIQTGVGRILIDNTAVNGTSYFYRATAVNAVNESAKSAPSNEATPSVGNTTPAAPTMSSDDTANTLSFGSPLGTSEIVVSLNGGGFVAYAGPYAIGDVVLAAGAYRAKVKAATGRNESGLTASPAFTTAPVLPSFNTTLEPGDNVSTVSWNTASGVVAQLKINLPLSTNTDINPAQMTVVAPDGTTQLAQADYNGADTGVQIAIVYLGTTYYKTFTNGPVTLS